MQLKEFQTNVLERLDTYLEVLSEKYTEARDYVEFQRERGKISEISDYCRDAWNALDQHHSLPLIRDVHGRAKIVGYIGRKDGLGRHIPNICFKVPTAGGKTLLAAAAVQRINMDFFQRQTGFVLWVVPSDSIYRQTWKALANREHPYRQMLERASGGRVLMLEKTDNFSKQDASEFLCVMLLMLQSSARQSKETLRMFRDSGKFTSFFPEVDDIMGNGRLYKDIPNLTINDLGDGFHGINELSIKHSLGNVLRIIRPIIIIDEGHKAYSQTARDTLNEFNPKFILELSATPNTGRERVSNTLVDISGKDLKDEEMIKLPINVINLANADWKYTLTESHAQLLDLSKAAQKLQAKFGRYIRPIMLIRVDRTGSDQRDTSYVHAEDAREYLIGQLGIKPEEVRVKSATRDELGDEDLLSNLSEVRYIITKDALREGWDCPFAYILTILSKLTAPTAATQMLGRILRQPETQMTGVPLLDESYVFTFDQDVKEIIDRIKKGLEEEGMGDLGQYIYSGSNGEIAEQKQVKITRRSRFKNLKIFLPRVLCKDDKGKLRVMDYDRDILANLQWDTFNFAGRDSIKIDDSIGLERTLTLIDMELGKGEKLDLVTDVDSEKLKGGGVIDFPFMVRLLMDVIPNPWQGSRILEETFRTLKKRKIPEEHIYTNRLYLLKEIKADLTRQVNNAAENLFRKKLANGEIRFHLVSNGDPDINWKLAENIEMIVSEDDRVLSKRNGESLENSLFEKMYEKDFNSLEKSVAWYIDGQDAIKWWHRITARKDYYLQGWQRHRIYPDFLICLNDLGDGKVRFSVLETKGEHLQGPDTAYKQELFKLLTGYSRTAVETGLLELQLDNQIMEFTMLMEDTWKSEIPV